MSDEAPAPWMVRDGYDQMDPGLYIIGPEGRLVECPDGEMSRADADFIVALRNDALRLRTIQRAAHALLDAIGPQMAGLDGAPPAVVEAATALQLACVGAQ